MNFSNLEEEARQIVLASRKEISIDEIWSNLGRNKKKQHWRSQACELMRSVCIKSEIIPPRIERKTRLGRGAKAFYGIGK